MKVRIISGAVAVVLLVVVLLLHKTIVFPLCIAAICAIAIFELLAIEEAFFRSSPPVSKEMLVSP